MELVRVLPSSEDEVNVACFHPSPGCGLVYGTKVKKTDLIKGDHSLSTMKMNIITDSDVFFLTLGGFTEDFPVQYRCNL